MALVDHVVGKFKDLSVNTKESPNESESAATPCGSGDQINGSVPVNYADRKVANMQLVDDKLLEAVLVNSGDSRRDIVIVGEGNFTFSIALAALRGLSWDGIVSTRYEKESASAPKPQISDVKLKSIEYCVQNSAAESKPDSTPTLSDKILAIIGLPLPPDGAWKFDIDATNLPPNLCVENKVVWFQCPWIPKKDRRTKSAIYDLILNFIRHMGDKQSISDYVLIGIANQFPYVKEYLLDKLLGENLSGPVGKYNFLGADNTLIKKILKFGYKHEAYRDIHDTIYCNHLTLVFEHQ